MAERAQSWLKFFKFMKKSMLLTFLIFCVKLQRHLLEWFFGEKFCIGIFEQKVAQIIVAKIDALKFFSDFSHEAGSYKNNKAETWVKLFWNNP